jgi:NitT/TauT family transport system substrate-binding protein
MAAAVVTSHLNIADSNVMTIAGAHVRGLPFMYIAPGNSATLETTTAHIVAAPGSSIKTGKDLNGKIVSGISIGSVDHVEMLAWIDKTGGDYTAVKYVEVAPAEIPAALAQGRIDAAVMNDPDYTAAFNAKTVRLLGNAMDGIAKQYVGNGWFASNEWIPKNADTVRRFQDAMAETADWANANPEKAAVILGKVTKIVEPRLHAKFAHRLDPTAMQPMLDAAFRYKVLPRALNAAEICWTQTLSK